MKILTMDDFLKRIQSRLKYNGITASKAECREAYCQLIPQENWNNPSADQVLLVVQKFTEWSDKNESDTEEVEQETSYSQAIKEPLVSSDLIEQISQPETFEITQSSYPDIWEIIQPPVEQPEPQENAPAEQLNEASALLNVEENKPPLQSNEIISSHQVKGMVLQVFANQPQEFKEQVTEYALANSFTNVRQVQEFLEQLRGMEFNLLVNTLQDHFNRRGSMLTVLNDVLTNQKTKDDEASQSFFTSFNSQLAAFQTEMESRLSKSGL